MFDNLILGFGIALSLNNLIYCFIGTLVGTFIGVLPGVGPLVTISMLLPLTLGLPPIGALIMLAGIYYGAQYGGSTTAILLNLPGETSSAVTCLDGYQMARQGRAGPALATAAIASLVAGCIGTVIIGTLGPTLAEMALKFGAAEYASLMVMALCTTSSLVKGSQIKGVLMAVVGLMLGLVGSDINTGIERFTFGLDMLVNGLEFVVITIGIFAISEVVVNAALPQGAAGAPKTQAITGGLMPTARDMGQSWKAMLRGTAIGTFFGILPGAGPGIASFAAYMAEKRSSRTPERFGNGAIEGVAAPEAANNAAAQAAFIPTLTLGIPGSPTMALLLGVLFIQGIIPGPGVMTRYPELFWGLVASMFIGNVLLVILNLPLVGLWVSLLRMPYRWLFPSIIAFSCMGIYTLNLAPESVVLAAVFGVIGFVFLKLDLEPAPFVLGFVLGPLFEVNLRRSLLISGGDPSIFFTRPISASFLAVGLGILIISVVPSLRRQKDLAIAEGGG